MQSIRFNPGRCSLTLQHLTEVTREPWQKAFNRENNLAGWKKTGVFPFTRQVQYQYKAKELASNQKTGHLRYQYLPPPSELSAFNACTDVLLPKPIVHPILTGDDLVRSADEVDERVEITMVSKQFSSACVWNLGPLTNGNGLAIIKQRAKEKNDEDIERKRKYAERTDISEQKRICSHEMGKTTIYDLDNGKLSFDKLTVCQIDACMIYYNLPIITGKVAVKSDALRAARVRRSIVLEK